MGWKIRVQFLAGVDIFLYASYPMDTAGYIPRNKPPYV
jgi:hypothetical protein